MNNATKESPIARFKGTITLPPHLTWPQVASYADTTEQAAQIMAVQRKEEEKAKKQGQAVQGNLGYTAQSRQLWIKVYCEILADSNIESIGKLTAENWPATPPKAAMELFQWVGACIGELFNEETEVPNA